VGAIKRGSPREPGSSAEERIERRALCWLGVILFYTVKHQQRSCRFLAETVEQEEGIINWDAFAVLLPLLTFAIGILTSLMGIGGGELIGPLLLTLRVGFPVSVVVTLLTCV